MLNPNTQTYKQTNVQTYKHTNIISTQNTHMKHSHEALTQTNINTYTHTHKKIIISPPHKRSKYPNVTHIQKNYLELYVFFSTHTFFKYI